MKPQIPVVALLLCLTIQDLGAAPGGRKAGKREREASPDFTPREAAQTARRQTGGRVLNVKPGNGGYRVKVLTPKGEVLYVPVDPPGR